MGLTGKVRGAVRWLLQAYGTPKIKSALWNAEFASGRWTVLRERRETVSIRGSNNTLPKAASWTWMRFGKYSR